MERVRDNKAWSLFSPSHVPGLTTCHSDEFNALYAQYEQDDAVLRQSIPAQTLWRAILVSQMETGTPYICFKDACNRRSNQQNLGTIRCSNLCVAPDTPILTSTGHHRIDSLVDKTVDVWNGSEFSETTVMKTGTDQNMVKVSFSNTMYINCTEYHKFHIATGSRNGKQSVVAASQLKAGDRIVKCDFPVIKSSTEQDMPHAYTHGFFCGRDGTYGNNAIPMVALYGDKKKLTPFLEIGSSSGLEDAMNCILHSSLAAKCTVPINASLECRLNWLAGLVDADGCVVHVSGKESIQISSTHLRMLQDVILMLQTMGVNANIRTDGQDAHRLFISNSDLIRLHALGFHTHRLKFTQQNLPNREAKRFIRVVSVEPVLGTSDTYCFNEPKRHMGVFGGIVAGNCSEIIQYTSSEETAVCNLASINVAAFCREDGSYDFTELVRVAERVCYNLNAIIDANLYPIPEAKLSNTRHRPIGIGQQGLANAFFKYGIPFGSEEALRFSTAISEAIYFGAVSASVKLAKRDGPYESYPGSPFSKGLFQFDLWKKEGLDVQMCGRFDWEQLRRSMLKFGIRNSLLTAQMPTASTSQILNNTESVEPLSSNLYLRRTNAGEFVLLNRFMAEDLIKKGEWTPAVVNALIASEGESEEDLYATVWKLSQRVVIDQAAARGPFIDQSQSMNLFMAAPTISKLSSMLFYGWSKGLKTGMYYLRTRAKAQAIKFVLEAKSNNTTTSVSSSNTCSLKSPDCQSCGA